MDHVIRFLQRAWQDRMMERGARKGKTTKKADFIFILHPRNKHDIVQQFAFFRFVPKFVLLPFLEHMWPMRIHKITALHEGWEYTGWTVALPLLPAQMLAKKELARRKTLQALRLGHGLGARMAGLGALTPSVTNGGLDIVDGTPIKITNGYATTVQSVVGTTLSLVKEGQLKRDRLIVAVLGAAGSVGNGTARLLAREGFQKLILIDVERKGDKLSALHAHITKQGSETDILTTSELAAVRDAHIIVTATNANECIIFSEHLSPGTLIIDDAQPSDVSPEVVEGRDDVVVTEAAIIHAPDVTISHNKELYDNHDLFSCLAEVILLTTNGMTEDHFSLGRLDMQKISVIGGLMQKTNFRMAEYQNYLGEIPAKQLTHTFNLLTQRYGHD